MTKRRKENSRRPGPGPAPRDPAWSWSRMARPVCPSCGSRRLSWMPPADLAFEVAPGERLRAFEGIAWAGEGGDAWHCRDCGNWGIFDGGRHVA